MNKITNNRYLRSNSYIGESFSLRHVLSTYVLKQSCRFKHSEWVVATTERTQLCFKSPVSIPNVSKRKKKMFRTILNKPSHTPQDDHSNWQDSSGSAETVVPNAILLSSTVKVTELTSNGVNLYNLFQKSCILNDQVEISKHILLVSLTDQLFSWTCVSVNYSQI